MLNPKTTQKEFGGDLGAIAITIGLPALTVVFYLLCNTDYVIGSSYSSVYSAVKLQVNHINWIQDVFLNFKVWDFYLKWFFGLMLLDILVPGKHLKGIKLRDNTQLDYKINGLNLLVVLCSVFAVRIYRSDNYFLPELEFIYNNFLSLAIVSICFSFILSNFLFIYSYFPLKTLNGFKTNERILSINGNSSSVFYNWFIGRELNPRIFNGLVDLKYFCELKPGLLLWLAILLSCGHHQYHEVGYIQDSLILVILLQLFYIFDGVLNEEGVISMIDITTDGFGFMLAFGDLSLVPFTYCLQARYLSLVDYHLGLFNCSLITILMFLGYYIFHSSNQQKSDWKSQKLNHKNYKYIQTQRGTRLLCDGWWAISQHTNYLGDWIISWSWCLCTGFSTFLTYYYVCYFAGLLIHRQQRDEAKCSAKYGQQWEEYKEKVPYKIVPYIY